MTERKRVSLRELAERAAENEGGAGCRQCGCVGPHRGNICRVCGGVVIRKNPRGRPSLPEEDQRRIARMAQVDASATEIARIVGVSRPTAYKYLRKFSA